MVLVCTLYACMYMHAHWEIKSQHYQVFSSVDVTLILGAETLPAHEAHHFRQTCWALTPKELLVSIYYLWITVLYLQVQLGF